MIPGAAKVDLPPLESLPGYQEQRFRVTGGHVLRVVQFGEGDQDVLSIMGGPGQKEAPSWGMLINTAFQRMTIINMRGVSGNTSERGPLYRNTTAHALRDLRALVQSLGLKKHIVLGGSWGSGQALAYAGQNPDKVIAVNTWANFTGREEESNRQINPEDAFVAELASLQLDKLMGCIGPDAPAEARTCYPTLARYLLDAIKKGGDRAKEIAVRYGMLQFALTKPIDPIDSNASLLYEFITSDDLNNMNWRDIYDTAVAFGMNPILEAKIALHYYANSPDGTESFSFGLHDHIVAGLDGLRRIEQGVHIANGDRDGSTPPANGEYAAELIGDNAQLTIVNSGHYRGDRQLARQIYENVQNQTMANR